MDAALQEVLHNDKEHSKVALSTVQKIVNNILSHQDEPKYRRLRTENKAIKEKILSVTGGGALLAALGFAAQGDELVLPMESSPVKLLQSRISIDAALTQLSSPPPPMPAPAPLAPTAPVAPAPEPMATGPALPDEDAMEVDGDQHARPEDGMDGDADLARAIAMSQQGGPAAAPDNDPELAAALALSLVNNGLRDPLPAPAAPAPAPAAPTPSSTQDALAQRVRTIFQELSTSGLDPNAAAAQALERAKREFAAAISPPPPPPPVAAPPPEVLSRQGLEARVKQLFAAEVANGVSPNEAAANALRRAQTEQLAAAAAERRRAAAPSSPAAEAPASDAAAAAAPPVLRQQSSGGAIEGPGFERWEEIEQVAAEQLEVINTLYRTEGYTFIDPSFAPHSDRSLYATELTATTWRCRACGGRSPLPPKPNEQELIRLMTDRTEAEKTISCAHCQSTSSRVETAMRPTSWRRPLNGELGIRDDVTLQFSTVPWVVFRGDPRPDDIRQGGVGNCWFVCALSCLAEYPQVLKKVILTPELNPAGAYQVRLCHGGEWKIVTVDDVFPTNAIHCLAYLKAARRQLWVPLIEKAAAKLHGSYEALEGGTFMEAFSMLTGFPVQRIVLSRYQPPPPPAAGAPPAEVEAHAKAREKWEKLRLDKAELFFQLFSFKQSGFAIGASNFAKDAATEAEMRAKGLNVPHAYCVLALTEVDGECLIKLRNPNGWGGWKGAWGRDSSRWTYDLRQELGLDNEDKGVFWMAWDDFCTYFGELTICRLLPDRVEARQGGWLSSIFNAGNALALEVFAHTRLELTVHQEPHITRGETSFALLLDLGLVVLKQARDGSWGLVGESERTLKPSGQLEATLEQDDLTTRYLVVPLCFAQLQSTEPRKFVISSHSTQPLSVESTPLASELLATAMIQLCLQGERRPILGHPQLGDMLVLYLREEEAGYAIVGENLAGFPIRVEVDASEGTSGFISSRGALFCQDILPPRSRQLLLVLTVDAKHKRHSFSLSFGGGALEPGSASSGNIPELGHLGELKGLHLPQPIGSGGGAGGTPAAAGGVDVATLAGNILGMMQQGRGGQS